MSVYPGPGTEILGALKLYPTYYTVGGPNHAVAIAPATPFSMEFAQTGTGFALYYLLPKLAAGDSWLSGYLTGWVSSNTTNAAANIGARLIYNTNGGQQISSGSIEAGVHVTAGAPIPTPIDHFLFPDLVNFNAQGVAVPILIDLSLNNANVTLGTTSSVLSGLNTYNTTGLRAQIIPTGTADRADIVIAITQPAGGAVDNWIYNPVVTLFSLLQYAWIPPSAGGISIAPELLVLGMFGRGRNA